MYKKSGIMRGQIAKGPEKQEAAKERKIKVSYGKINGGAPLGFKYQTRTVKW